MRKVALVFIPILVGLLSWQLANMENGSISSLTRDPPHTVPYVDINKYLGVWYEQAAIPVFYENNCERTTANYSLINSDTIRVDN